MKKTEAVSNVDVAESISLRTFNYTDILANNNKAYVCEIVKDTSSKYWLHTMYGRVGGTMSVDYRSCSDLSDAEKEAEKIIKSKLKKGYVEVKLVKASVGSEKGQEKVETSKMSIAQASSLGVIDDSAQKSSLHKEVQGLVKSWFGSTADYVELKLNTQSCPLGQLSFEQISKGKDLIDELRKLIHSTKKVESELDKLTSGYYSNIPHNFGYTRIDPNSLRLDSDQKLDQALDFLDILGSAKNVQGILTKKSAIDDQFKSLNSEIEFIDPTDPLYKWIHTMFHETRASNHSGLGKLKVHKMFKLNRKNEKEIWLETAEKIAKENCTFNPSSVYAHLIKSRPDIPKELETLYKKANILPGWHGTRKANMVGITTKGLLIRPSGVVHSGSMYGDGIYVGSNSSKSINYVDVAGSYWAQGTNKTGFLFLADCIFGKQKLASYSSYYSKDNIKPNHSVWAKAGGGGVINDEMILYNQTGPGQQHYLRYVIEFETHA